MFKRLEAKWNAHTPRFLHPRTKENIIFQLGATVLLLLGFVAKDVWDERQRTKRYNSQTSV